MMAACSSPLKPQGERNASADQVINRLRPKLAKLQGITLYMQAAQDITIGGAAVEDPVSIHADRCRFRRAQPLVADLPRQAQEDTGHHRRRQRPGECRAAARHHGQSRRRIELRDPARDDRQHARRCVRPAHRLDDVHPAQPVPRRAGGRPAIPVRPRRAERHLYQLLKRPAGAAEHPGQQHHQAGADRRQPSGHVPVGHDLLQPEARRGARRRGRRHPPAGAAARQTRSAGDELPGQRSGVPVLTVERADPDRVGAGRDLHHPRRAL